MSPDLTTAVGVIAAMTAVITVLWRAHEQSDREMRVDRNYWRDLALTGSELADKATTIAIRKRDG